MLANRVFLVGMKIDLYREVCVDFPVYRRVRDELDTETGTHRQVFLNLKAELWENAT